MKPFLTIRQAGAKYPVYVGRDLVGRIGELVPGRGRVFVITSESLRARFGDPWRSHCGDVFPAGRGTPDARR
jgi:hypothetical protein